MTSDAIVPVESAGSRWGTVTVYFALVVLLFGIPLLYRDIRHRGTRNFRVVEEGVLYRSGQMSPEAFARVCRERGLRTVIKLRDPSNSKDAMVDALEEEHCRQNGIVFHRREPKDWEPDDTGRVPAEENLRWFESVMADESLTPRPVLVHCFAGIHRTGAMVVAYRVGTDGWTNEEAVAEFRSCGKPSTTYVGNMLPFLLRYQPTGSRGGE